MASLVSMCVVLGFFFVHSSVACAAFVKSGPRAFGRSKISLQRGVSPALPPSPTVQLPWSIKQPWTAPMFGMIGGITAASTASLSLGHALTDNKEVITTVAKIMGVAGSYGGLRLVRTPPHCAAAITAAVACFTITERYAGARSNKKTD